MKKKVKKALSNHEKIAEIVKESGLTQEELAKIWGITDRYLRNLKSKDADISLSLAYIISEYSGKSINSLLTINA